MIKSAKEDSQIGYLHSIYKANEVGFVPYNLSTLLRWELVFRLMASSSIPQDEKDRILESLKAEDNSDVKNTWIRKIEALLLRGEERVSFFKTLLDPGMKMSYYELSDHLTGLSSSLCPEEELSSLIPSFICALPMIMNEMTVSQIKMFVYYFSPNVNDVDAFEKGIAEAEGKVLEKNTFGKKKINQLWDEVKLVCASRKVE